MSSDTVVRIENVVKSFEIPTEAHSGIKQKIINQLKGVKGYKTITPLNGVSFEVQKGDFFGIVGRNGSGKSTLLKTIAGIYTPDEGDVHVAGSLVPFIELGVGFNPELTGRENVYLNGALLGFSHSEVEAIYEDIVDFAELHDFMDEKLKNYSSGMQVRLAFSIAIRAEGDILLLDEVLAVGDEAFQRKCHTYFSELKRNKKTVILVTHSMAAVESFCTKALLLEGGEIVAQGDPHNIATLYSKSNEVVQKDTPDSTADDSDESIRVTLNSKTIAYNEMLKVKLQWKDKRVRHVAVALYRADGQCVYDTNTKNDTISISENQTSINYSVRLNVLPGEYFIRVGLYDALFVDRIGFYDQVAYIHVTTGKNGRHWEGITMLESSWTKTT